MEAQNGIGILYMDVQVEERKVKMKNKLKWIVEGD